MLAGEELVEACIGSEHERSGGCGVRESVDAGWDRAVGVLGWRFVRESSVVVLELLSVQGRVKEKRAGRQLPIPSSSLARSSPDPWPSTRSSTRPPAYSRPHHLIARSCATLMLVVSEISVRAPPRRPNSARLTPPPSLGSRSSACPSSRSCSQDAVPVFPQSFSLKTHEAITNHLNKKYSNRVLQEVGLCFCVWDLIECGDGKVRWGDGAVWYKGASKPLMPA